MTGYEPSEQTTDPPRRALTLDLDRYQSRLDEFDLPPEQHEDYLRLLWTIMVSFVELGFKPTPEEPCGQPSEIGADPALALPDMLESEDIQTTGTFKRAADAPAVQRDKEDS